MAQSYFKNFPKINYKLSNGRWVTVRDFFRKSKIDQESVNSIIDYQFYELKDGERPDIVAHRLYGSSKLHWTFFLVNQMENYLDWYKDQRTMEVYMNEKYPGKYLLPALTSDIIGQDRKFLIGEKLSSPSANGRILQVEPTYKRIGVSKGAWSEGETVTGEVSGKTMEIESVIDMIDGVAYYKDANGLKRNYDGAGFTSVSLWEMEEEENEEKRLIKYIRPELIRKVVREFERVMSN